MDFKIVPHTNPELTNWYLLHTRFDNSNIYPRIQGANDISIINKIDIHTIEYKIGLLFDKEDTERFLEALITQHRKGIVTFINEQSQKLSNNE